jgi:CheY-like chemotaxis protein
MSFILAIEPDRRQAARISALARNSLNVEVVITDSAERALAAISERIPDLILTPRLMSPKDEATLDKRLRELDGAGRHVQTLMIPLLASGGKKEAGLLNRLRRSSSDDSSEGCDPQVFAAQIAEYLERADAERHLALERDRHKSSHDAADIVTAADVTLGQPAAEEPGQSASGEPDQPAAEEPDALAVARADDVVVAPEELAAFVDHLEAQLGSKAAVQSQPDAPAETHEPIAATAIAPAASVTVRVDLPVETSEETPENPVDQESSDEWGYFDPQRVGFAALLAKLDEVTTAAAMK